MILNGFQSHGSVMRSSWYSPVRQGRHKKKTSEVI